nr:uncharacterized protein LOC128700043 isoform X2 [Cherax quadricarinatus]
MNWKGSPSSASPATGGDEATSWLNRPSGEGHCRIACWSHRQCHAVAVDRAEVNEGVECRLSNKSPINSTLVNNTQATYYYWKAPLKGLVNQVMGDTFLYYIPEEPMNFTSAKELCKKIPGFRLFMPKLIVHYTIALQLFKKNGPIWVDLHRAENKTIKTWGDQTPYNDSQISSLSINFADGEDSAAVYRIDNEYSFNDCDFTKKFLCVCHANPLGLDW